MEKRAEGLGAKEREETARAKMNDNFNRFGSTFLNEENAMIMGQNNNSELPFSSDNKKGNDSELHSMSSMNGMNSMNGMSGMGMSGMGMSGMGMNGMGMNGMNLNAMSEHNEDNLVSLDNDQEQVVLVRERDGASQRAGAQPDSEVKKEGDSVAGEFAGESAGEPIEVEIEEEQQQDGSDREQGAEAQIPGAEQQDEGVATAAQTVGVEEGDEDAEAVMEDSVFSNVGQGLTGAYKNMMMAYWQETINSIEHDEHDFKNHHLPLARIKKVMKTDEEVRMISAEAPILFAKGCDIFITELTMRAWIHAEENKRRTLQRSDIAAALQKSDMFDFLIDIVPREEEHRPKRHHIPSRPPSAAPPQANAGASAGSGSVSYMDQINQFNTPQQEFNQYSNMNVYENRY